MVGAEVVGTAFVGTEVDATMVGAGVAGVEMVGTEVDSAEVEGAEATREEAVGAIVVDMKSASIAASRLETVGGLREGVRLPADVLLLIKTDAGDVSVIVAFRPAQQPT